MKQTDKTIIKEEIKPKASDYLRSALFLFKEFVLKNKKLILYIFIILLIIAGGIFYWVSRPSSVNLSNDEVIISVNKQLNISGDSNPAVLSVTDKEKVSQPFLEEAENGDKVLLYYNAKKAVLFRPGENRIIHHGTYTPPAAKIFLREGTDNDSKITEVKDKLDQIKDINIASQDISPRKDYQGVTLVSVTDRYDEKLQELSQLFGVQVSRLPAGESFPDADILIIVGS